MKKFLLDFKAFALKGNVLDLAVGVMIGAAFQSVVSSLTDNILKPIIGIFMRTNLDSLVLTLPAIDVTINYGTFFTSVINFIIMALVVFCIVRAINRLLNGAKKEVAAPPPAPTTKKCPYCLSDIQLAATRCPACTSQLEGE